MTPFACWGTAWGEGGGGTLGCPGVTVCGTAAGCVGGLSPRQASLNPDRAAPAPPPPTSPDRPAAAAAAAAGTAGSATAAEAAARAAARAAAAEALFASEAGVFSDTGRDMAQARGSPPLTQTHARAPCCPRSRTPPARPRRRFEAAMISAESHGPGCGPGRRHPRRARTPFTNTRRRDEAPFPNNTPVPPPRPHPPGPAPGPLALSRPGVPRRGRVVSALSRPALSRPALSRPVLSRPSLPARN